MADILFKTEDWVFSYRVAGICVKNGCVLLQRAEGDTGYAFPGGHVSFGETNAQTLVREFREETGGEITAGELKWVGEIFFPWGNKSCHQICLYYLVELKDQSIPESGHFPGKERNPDGSARLEFFWALMDALENLEVYPVEALALLKRLSEGVQHFVCQE